ncbi:hypothetical protein GCM10018790_01810 [Kitasatospora xanthocidica]|nr:hypothetical protein GCM10018790_01810 [Kitasatospora xanthocidica]
MLMAVLMTVRRRPRPRLPFRSARLCPHLCPYLCPLLDTICPESRGNPLEASSAHTEEWSPGWATMTGDRVSNGRGERDGGGKGGHPGESRGVVPLARPVACE